MAENAKERIQRALQDENDPKFRLVIMLMLATIEDIGSKIDEFRNDEKSLRDAVLNGHAHVHDSDHEWIESWRRRDTEMHKVCAWASEKMIAEEKNLGSYRRVIEAVAGHIAIAGGALLTGYLLAGI